MNKVIMTGRLTRDPDIRYSTDKGGEQMCIARYTLAVDSFGDGADYPSCVAFKKQGEFAEKYLKKGMKIAIEGRIKTGSYEKDGHKIYTTDIVVERHEFCESKGAEKEQAPAVESAPDFVSVPDNITEGLPFKL